MPTTSPPPRRSKSKRESAARGGPLKSVRLSVTIFGAGSATMERLAAEKGLTVEVRKGELKVGIASKSPEDALAQLRLLSGALAQKP